MSANTITYTVDGHDTIVDISDSWHAFAEGNSWSGPVQSRDVVGHSLWRFIQGPEVQHLYHLVFDQARRGYPCRGIPFRCDSPGERRYLELRVEPGEAGHLHLHSTTIRAERRHPVKLLDTEAPRFGDIVKLCSMCKKMRVSPDHWAEIEQGLVHLRVFEAEGMPALSHGLCSPCLDVVMNRAGL